MAQAKTIQLLRSSQVYASLEAAKEALLSTTVMNGRKDGELLLARYNYTKDNVTTIKSLIGVYHAAPDLENGTPTGVTFIEDLSTAAGTSAALQAEVDAIEASVGLGTNGTKTDFSGAAVTDNVIGASDTLIAAIQKVANTIAGMDKAASAVDGQVVTTVSEANGVVSETKANVKDLQLGGYSKDTSATGAIGSTDTVNTALSKLENTIAQNTVTSEDGTVTIDATGSTTDLSVNIDGTTLVKDATDGTISSALKVIKVIPTGTAGTDEVVDTTLGTNIKEAYRLVYNDSNNPIGKQINVYKDSALSRVYLGHVDDTINSSTGAAATTGTGDTALCFVYHKEDGTYELVPVNVQSFLQESEFGNGLQVDNHVVSVKIDSTSEKDSQSTPVDFLSVSSNGIKVSGIKDEIDRKIAALDVTDTAVAGQYVSAVNETDGKVAMTRANVSEAVLNNYAKGTAPASLDIAATDTINQAFAKLEHKIADGVASLDADVTSTNGTNVQVQVVETDGKITAVNVTDNSINATDLNNKIATLDGSAIATAASGNVYTVLTGVTETDGIISKTGEVTLAAVAKTGAAEDVSVAADVTSGLAAGNVQDTLEALTAATSNGLDSVSSGNAAIAVGTKTNKDQSVSLVLDASTGNNITTGTVTDMLTITNNGLAMNDTWDCGTF